MANTRTVSIVVCGAVMGIIVGAGAVAAVEQSGLAATIQARTSNYYANNPRPDAVVRSQATKNYMFHGAPLPYHYTRRRIDQNSSAIYRDPDLQDTYSKPKDTTQQSSSAAATKSLTPCDVAKATVETVKATYLRYVPVTMKNTELRANMDNAFVAAVNEYCAPSVPAAAVPARGSTHSAAAIDNNCMQYPKQTIRYTQCVMSQQNGVKYP